MNYLSLLENNDYYLKFEEDGEIFYITYNEHPDNYGFILLNENAQRLDKEDYLSEFQIGKKLLTEQYLNKEKPISMTKKENLEFQEEYKETIEELKFIIEDSNDIILDSTFDKIFDEFETAYWYDMVDAGYNDDNHEKNVNQLKEVLQKALIVLKEKDSNPKKPKKKKVKNKPSL